MYWSTNMSSRIGSNMHWLHQYATKFNMIYNTYWNSYRIVQGMQYILKFITYCPEGILRFITSRRFARQCILLRSICLRIPVQYILGTKDVARSQAQYILTMGIWLSSIPSIRIAILDVLLRTIRIEMPSLNYYSLGRWILLSNAGYASSIGGGWN